MRRAMLAAMLVLATQAQAARCVWAEPGGNPYTGAHDVAARRLGAPDAVALAMRQGLFGARVRIYRSHIEVEGAPAGTPARFGALRSMNFGAGQVCAGDVDRSMWPADRYVRASVYTSGGSDAYVVVDDCRNVALVTDQQGAQRQALAAGVRAVPEPSSLVLLAAVGAWLATRWARRAPGATCTLCGRVGHHRAADCPLRAKREEATT